MEKTWIVIADGARAAIYRYQGPSKPLKPVPGGDLKHINKPSRELVSSERGRVFKSVGSQRAAMERPTDPHEHEKHVFAREVAAFLEKRAARFDRLLLVAAPKVLGDLREFLPGKVLEKVTAELNKDLTHLRAEELPQHLQAVINIEPDLRHRNIAEAKNLSPKIKQQLAG